MTRWANHLAWKSQYPVSRKDEKNYLARIRASRSDIVWVIMVQNTRIGTCGLHHVDLVHGHAKVAIYIQRPEYRQLGMGQEVMQVLRKYARNRLRMRQLTAETLKQNHAGQHLLKQTNFVLCGVHPGRYWLNGAAVDSTFWVSHL